MRLGTFSDLNGDTDPDHGHPHPMFKCDRNNSPPSSPNISKHSTDKELGCDHMELQLDYWFLGPGDLAKSLLKAEQGDKENNRKADSEKSKKQSDLKSSIKTHFKNLSISQLSSDQAHSFSMSYTTKEKKPKAAVLKLGKKKDKPGDLDSKFQSIDGINRLICMSKSNLLLKVAIDSQEWSGVKFFQVSSQWQTHIKHLPVCIGTISDHL